jgi:hypothetical protein
MGTPVERRRPDRQQFVLRFLRRIAVLALTLAFAIWAVPRLLTEAGIIGPTAAQAVDEAARAVAIARAYGAREGIVALRVAEAELSKARGLAAAGEDREAKRVARHAAEAAIEAQKLVLVEMSETRAKAQAVYDDLDEEINGLEELYAEVTPGLPKEQVARLLSVMKATRSTTGLLFLAYEQKDYAMVLERETNAREVVESARRSLESARRPRP